MANSRLRSLFFMLSQGKDLLRKSPLVANPRGEAVQIMDSVIREENSWLVRESITEQEEEEFNRRVQQRVDGVPLAYVIAKKEFWSMKFEVNEHTLIPRADTEVLVETALV